MFSQRFGDKKTLCETTEIDLISEHYFFAPWTGRLYGDLFLNYFNRLGVKHSIKCCVKQNIAESIKRNLIFRESLFLPWSF